MKIETNRSRLLRREPIVEKPTDFHEKPAFLNKTHVLSSALTCNMYHKKADRPPAAAAGACIINYYLLYLSSNHADNLSIGFPFDCSYSSFGHRFGSCSSNCDHIFTLFPTQQ
jgi:hypothetical protein